MKITCASDKRCAEVLRKWAGVGDVPDELIMTVWDGSFAMFAARLAVVVYYFKEAFKGLWRRHV